jgi:PAS domain S-box-containing protein
LPVSNIHNASRRWRLRTYLIVLVVLFMAASAGSVGYEQVRAVHNAQQAATSDARFAARLAAHDITTALDTLSRTLADVTANPDIGQAFTPDIDPATCPLTFAGVGGFQTGHIDIIRQDGSVTCSSLKEGRTRTYRGESWLARAFTAPGVTGPVVDARTGKRVVLGTAPVPGHGVVAGFLNLDSLGPGLASVYGGPRGLTFLITSADRNIILTRSTDPARWVGAQVRDTPFRADPQHAEQPDPDGVVRLYGSALVPGLGWYVFAGANREEALAAAHALSSQQAALSIAALLVILAAAWGFHRRIVQPIRRLNASVREGVTGNRPRPVPVEGPAELAELAEDFNETIDATQRHLTDVSRLAAIVRSSTDAIIGKTLEGIITSWNNGAEEVYGYTSEEIVGRPVTVLVPPDRHDEVDTILERVSRGERVERLETRRVRKDGTEFDASVSISPILAPNGTIVGASAVTRDISELKRAAEERASLEQRLQQSQRLESLGQLAGGGRTRLQQPARRDHVVHRVPRRGGTGRLAGRRRCAGRQGGRGTGRKAYPSVAHLWPAGDRHPGGPEPGRCRSRRPEPARPQHR